MGGGLAFAATLMAALGAIDMSADLRNPLWWLSGHPMVYRLAVWTGARTLRLAMPLCLLIAAFTLVAPGAAGFAIPTELVIILVLWLFQLVALVAYTLLPARSDAFISQAIRLALVYAVLIAIAVPAIVVGILSHSFLGAIIGSLTVALPATVGGLFFAALRIEGNGQAFAREAGL
jgi:hypothetical protein